MAVPPANDAPFLLCDDLHERRPHDPRDPSLDILMFREPSGPIEVRTKRPKLYITELEAYPHHHGSVLHCANVTRRPGPIAFAIGQSAACSKSSLQ